jgi:predicted nucleotidyltransferase
MFQGDSMDLIAETKDLNITDLIMVHMNQKRINIELEIMIKLLKSPSHGRQLSKETDIPLTTVQRFLTGMELKNVIDCSTSGRNKIYSVKKNIFAREYTHNAENYKLLKLIGKYEHLEPVISDISKAGCPLIVIFGSYAKFTAKKDSDIDVYLETSDRKVKDKIEMVNSRLSVKIGPFDRDSLLIKEIINDHVIIKGVENFYDKLRLFE